MCVIGAAQLCVFNILSGSGSVDKSIIAYIDTNMSNLVACIRTGKEYQVAGLKLRFADLFNTGMVLVVRSSLNADAKVIVNILHKTGAIKSLGSCAAPKIGNTEELGSIITDILTELSFFGGSRRGAGFGRSAAAGRR